MNIIKQEFLYTEKINLETIWNNLICSNKPKDDIKPLDYKEILKEITEAQDKLVTYYHIVHPNTDTRKLKMVGCNDMYDLVKEMLKNRLSQ